MKAGEAEKLQPGTLITATCWNAVYGGRMSHWVGKVESAWRVSSQRTMVSVRDCAGCLLRIWSPDIRLPTDEERESFAVGVAEYEAKAEQDRRIARVLGIDVMAGSHYSTISLTPEEALAIVERLERCECGEVQP